MNQVSRQVQSNQTGENTSLESVVTRHLHSDYQKPLHFETLKAFERLIPTLKNNKIVLDSGCGVGESTTFLATKHPDCVVIGLEKSVHRIEKAKRLLLNASSDNIVICRADVVDFWRLLNRYNIRVFRHYLLYPNPWPKQCHLMRRWHGHPVFPDLLRVSQHLELRTNWETYAREFSSAIAICCHHRKPEVQNWVPIQNISPFERKYWHSGQKLWRLCWHKKRH